MNVLSKRLKSSILKVKKGIKYLQEIMTQIPSNVIFFKTITGIGATFLELIALRCSIIIEPNVPVIRGKRKRRILGVYEGVCTQDVVNYLSNKEFKYKKILVTPESFYKVMDAAEILGIDIYNEYFLLFDECDRTARDVDFRKMIIKPMDDFFKFKNKAFISATAMTPSDPRFAQQGFKELVLVPLYEIAKKLKLVVTNNVINAFKKMLEDMRDDGEKVCVFFNTTTGIATIIDQFGIKDECAVFCSKDSMVDLRTSGIVNAHEHFDADKMKKYNFFTSRFYAAVDMVLENEKPHVFMLTELFTAQHSMIDPHSDAIQIVGRFRNGVSSITAISNIDDSIPYKSLQEAKSYLQGCEHSYMDIRGLKNASTNLGSIETLQRALELVPYAEFMFGDGRKNHFMHDHFFHKENLKSYYTRGANLLHAYCNTSIKGSKKKYFEVEPLGLKYPVDDKDTKYRNPLTPYKDKVAFVVGILEQYDRFDPEKEEGAMFVLDNYDIVFSELNRQYPEIVKGYEVLGKEQLIKIAYSKTNVKKATEAVLNEQERNHYPLIADLHARFSDGMVIEDALRKSEFQRLIEKHGLSLTPTLANFQLFFDVSNRFTCQHKHEKKCRRIIRSRFNRNKG